MTLGPISAKHIKPYEADTFCAGGFQVVRYLVTRGQLDTTMLLSRADEIFSRGFVSSWKPKSVCVNSKEFAKIYFTKKKISECGGVHSSSGQFIKFLGCI